MTSTKTFQKTAPWHYTGVVNGRTFHLRRTRSFRNYTVRVGPLSWQKYRRPSTCTWYEVWETVDDDNVSPVSPGRVTPGYYADTLKDAITLATRLAHEVVPTAAPTTVATNS